MGNTVKDLLAWGNATLEAESPTPLLDAQLILGHLSGMDRLALFMGANREMPQDIIVEYEKHIEERHSGRPIAYIVGHQEFMGLDFKVSESVLIPRPDTEILVEAVLESEVVRGREALPLSVCDSEPTPTRWPMLLDLCTGSGAIAISLLYNMQEWHGVAVDLSPEALAVAEYNRDSILGGSTRLEIVEGDVFTFTDAFNFIDAYKEKFDVVVSNPPYIPVADMETLPVSVRDHEPHMALDGGMDGLDFYRKIVADGVQYLRRGGLMAVEVGHDQANDVSRLMCEAGYEGIRTYKDLQGFERVVAGVLMNGISHIE